MGGLYSQRQNDLKNSALAFHNHQYRSVRDAWERGFNEMHWRLGLVFNLGNGMNVSENRVRERLRFIASKLLRTMYGNRYRGKATVRFAVTLFAISARPAAPNPRVFVTDHPSSPDEPGGTAHLRR